MFAFDRMVPSADLMPQPAAAVERPVTVDLVDMLAEDMLRALDENASPVQGLVGIDIKRLCELRQGLCVLPRRQRQLRLSRWLHLGSFFKAWAVL